MQIQQADLDFLSTNGYLSVMQKEDYDQAVAEVSSLTELNEEFQNETIEERREQVALEKEERKTHSILFHLEGRDKKQAELEGVENERGTVSKEEADIAQKDSKMRELIQEKIHRRQDGAI